ncbi:UNVERIFIED_CONTAM: hypothetical protein Sradi_0878100 [Sesamum radiatum]|uniref:Retroviral polymerase SH3-like domain-containing protein n=1 Tax=Sesamum radiatum TaxID=300843 RepID=A0AAW2V309_SESRA
MMSLTELPPSFWDYALETTIKLLNATLSMTVPRMLYEIWHGSPAYIERLVGDKLDSRSSLCRFVGYLKETAGYYFYNPSEQKVSVSRNRIFLEKGFPMDSRRYEVLLEETSEAPQQNNATSFEPMVSTDSVPVLHRSTRESRPPNRYGFLGLTSQLDIDPRTYVEAMSDIHSDKWLDAMRSEMDSIGSNQVWTLVDPLKCVKPVGCKWVYKCKLRAEGRLLSSRVGLWKNDILNDLGLILRKSIHL